MEKVSKKSIRKIINHINIKYCKDDFLRSVFLVIIKKINSNSKNPFDLHGVCSSLCVSERTLYRRLRDRKMTYLGVKDEIRKPYALFLLSFEGCTVDQVSKFLFFRSSSAFIESFKRWYGYTPKKWAHVKKEIS
ncbi:MAG: AraC family transcriptional regulator [Reinekea sp.]